MQADYSILPKRNGKVDKTLTNKIKFFTNFYDISLNPKSSKIYQYSFALPEEIPQDSAEVYNQAVKSVRKELQAKIGYLSHSGQLLWGNISLQVPTTLTCSFKLNEKDFSLEAVVKPTKSLDLSDLQNTQFRPRLLQILNSNLKLTLRNLKLCPLGKQGQYFQNYFEKSQQLLEKGLQVLKGYKFTIVPLNSGLSLQIDVCSRVLQSKNLLEIFNGKGADFNKQKFRGATVITKYGTFRTYRIQEIDYGMSPMSKFSNDKMGKQMTYMQYYKDVYGLKINNNKQPLLLAIKNIKKEFVKGGKELVEVPEYCYLVPELVSPTGMTDDQRADHNTMKDLAPFTKLTPTDRIRQCQGIVEDINNQNGLIQIKGARRLEGYVLDKPSLLYAGGGKTVPDNRGNIKFRGVLKEAFNFTDWTFVYTSLGKRDDGDADNAFDLLKKSGQTYGVRFKDPGFIIAKDSNIKAWKDEISRDVQSNGVPQIIVLYLNKKQQGFYSELKRFITNEIKCPCQFIRKRTLENPKGAMSAASKIIIQMNVKVGSVPWQVKKQHPYFKEKNLMYGAISISKQKKGYSLAFVGTINPECTKVCSEIKMGIKSKENIPPELLEDIFINWAKTYYKTNNKKVPNLIILYREGLSDRQTKDQLTRTQIPALEAMVQQIGAKTGTKNYKPQIMIVTVNKKISSRYFSIVKENQQNPNKFVPELVNPDSGSVMTDAMSIDDGYDFHLAAQYVTQGTCTPTLFKVAYDTTKMTQQALMNFTFEQCFNYYNWEGAVRVPACLQCADKLSKLVSQYIREEIDKDNPVMKKHFFL